MILIFLIRYEINRIGLGFYRAKKAYDPVAFLRTCTFNGKPDPGYLIPDAFGESYPTADCRMFEPFLTNHGICYSFNSKGIDEFLKDSKYKKDFMDIYRSEMATENKKPLRTGVGSGPSLALNFVLDNNGYYRKQNPRFNFLASIGSFKEAFDMRSAPKLIKSGYQAVYEVNKVQLILK